MDANANNNDDAMNISSDSTTSIESNISNDNENTNMIREKRMNELVELVSNVASSPVNIPLHNLHVTDSSPHLHSSPNIFHLRHSFEVHIYSVILDFIHYNP
jgi:hypothetical protein